MIALCGAREQRTESGKRVIIADFEVKIQIDFANQTKM